MPQEEQEDAQAPQMLAENIGEATEEDVLDSDAAISEVALDADEQHLVLKRLLAAHEAWFNVYEDYSYAGKDFEGYAEFHSTGEQYILTKKAKIWEINAYEYLFFKLEDHLTEADVAHYVEFMTTEAIKKVSHGKDDMSSYISIVLIANSCDEGVVKAVRKARFRKNFMLGIRGWADLRICVVDLKERVVLSNAAGKEMKSALEANAGFTSGKGKKTRR